jgi:DNA-binding PadR family transcriptional regulator
VRLLSPNAARLLALFLATPERPLYGYELMRSTGIKSGSLYPVLGRFESLGWLVGSMEESPGGRPPRRVYTLTSDAVVPAQAALDRFYEEKNVVEADRLAWGTL